MVQLNQRSGLVFDCEEKFLLLQFSCPLSPQVKVKVTQLCPTLCYPMEYTFHGILQARTLEWIAFSFSRGSSQPRDQTQVSHNAGGFFTSWATREARAHNSQLLIIWSTKDIVVRSHMKTTEEATSMEQSRAEQTAKNGPRILAEVHPTSGLFCFYISTLL